MIHTITTDHTELVNFIGSDDPVTSSVTTLFTFTIAGKPVPKGRPRFARQGGFVRTYTDEKTLGFEQLVAYTASRHFPSPVETPCSVTVVVDIAVPASWSKKKRQQALEGLLLPTGRPDGDNVLKSVMDGMNGAVYMDDKQVVRGCFEKRYGAVDQTVVTVEFV